MKKICTGCHTAKELEEFSENPRYKGGHVTRCKTCMVLAANTPAAKIKQAQWRKRNRKHLNEAAHTYYHANREAILERLHAKYQAKTDDKTENDQETTDV